MTDEMVPMRGKASATFHLVSLNRENHTACGRSTLNTRWNDGWIWVSRNVALRKGKRECKACFARRTG